MSKIIGKALAVAVIILFLGLAVQPSVAVQPEQEVEVEHIENNSNQEEVKPNSFCILRVYTWAYMEWIPHFPYPFALLKCKDLDTGITRFGTTILFGYKFFIGLQIGHTYRITAIPFGKEKVIELKKPMNYVELFLGYMWG